MAGWLTPDSIPASTICRTLEIPDDIEGIYSVVSGALYALTLPENWQKHGTIEPADIAAAMQVMYFAFLESSCP